MALQYPLSYLFLALTCFGGSTVTIIKNRYLPIAVVGLYVGVCFTLLAIAYLMNAPGVLGKRQSGGRNPIAFLLMAPYLVVSAVSQSLSRSKAPHSEVLPGLRIGRRLNDDEAEAMIRDTGVRTIIDLACEHSETAIFRTMNYHSIPVLDAMPPTPEQLVDAMRVIEKHLPQGPVYVHCALGFGRSGAVAAAYLIRVGLATDVKNAISQLKRYRPGVILSRGQRDAVTAATTRWKSNTPS